MHNQLAIQRIVISMVGSLAAKIEMATAVCAILVCRTIEAENINKKKTFTYLPTLLFSTFITRLQHVFRLNYERTLYIN